MIAYLKTLIVTAKSQASTYVALVLLGLAELPELIPTYWADIEGLLPTATNKEAVHHLLLGVGAVAALLVRAHLAAKAAKP
jgi:hypothetical protein